MDTPDLSCSSSLSGDSEGQGSPPSSPADPLPGGVYVPMIAFYTSSQEIDLPATQRHASRLLNAGVAGLVVHGSNGEAVHLSRAERTQVIRAVADAARHEAAEHPQGHNIPVVAGCSGESVSECLSLCREAAAAGATHAIVLPPGYYRALLDADAVVRFFWAVAAESPIPLLVYNFPAAAHGLDLDSDVLLRIARHPRVVGAKLTCGNTGKLARLAAGAARGRGRAGNDFLVAGGSADFILQGLVVGARATIAGLANLAPRACVRVFELWDAGRLAEARELQAALAAADWLAIRYGFLGVKAAMPMFYGEGERGAAEPRRPFRRLDVGGSEVREICEGMAELMKVEAALQQNGVVEH